MSFRDSEFHLLHFDSADAQARREFRRENLVAIFILAFILLGVFLATLLPPHGSVGAWYPSVQDAQQAKQLSR